MNIEDPQMNPTWYDVGQWRVRQGNGGQSLGKHKQNCASLGEGAQSGTMIDEATLGRDKEISVWQSLKVILWRWEILLLWFIYVQGVL